MPILDIEVVGEIPSRSSLAQELADAGAKVLKREKPGQIWVKLRSLPCEKYAENGGVQVQPVFISLLTALSLSSQEKSEVALGFAQNFAPLLDRPQENIHVLFEAEAKGRIAFGGVLLK